MFAVLALSLRAVAAPSRALADLAGETADAAVSGDSAARQADGAAPGLARYEFRPGPAPFVRVSPRNQDWNWQDARALTIRLQNPMPWALTLIVTVRDAQGGELRSIVGLPPGPPCTLVVPLRAVAPERYGMRAGPHRPFGEGAACRQLATRVTGALDLLAVHAIDFSMPAPQAVQSLMLGAIALAGDDADERAAYAGLVDAWGQNTRLRWPERIASDAELKHRFDAETAALERAAAPPVALDRYGGVIDAAGPRLAANGFFRTERIVAADGRARWWLVTPEGHRFWSIGVNAVEAVNGASYVQGREWMFAGLPDEHGRFARRWSVADSRRDTGAQRLREFGFGRAFDVYGANLQRLYGDDYGPAWRARAARRLQAWGFNTIGNWSDDALARSGLPYTQSIAIAGDYATVSDGRDWWGRMPDPFDPRFEQAARRAIGRAVRDRRDDPWLLGYFVDNELAWGNGASPDPHARFALGYNTLRHALDGSPAKARFVALLRERYADVARLAQAWGVEVHDWREVEAAGFEAPPATPDRPAISRDLAAFQIAYADAYYGTVKRVLHEADPHHLYLGSRFSARTPESVASCARLCDVVSFNLYLTSLATGFEAREFAALDRPGLVAEFHFGSSDRGPLWGGVVEAESEQARGALYAGFIDSVLAQPSFVGAHWFQYADQPVTGRLLDGENGHFGLVGITDLPYGGFVDAVRTKNRAVLQSLGTRP